MRYQLFCDYLERLEGTSKRLEITKILVELITRLDEREVAAGVYLSLGYLNPPYNQLKFNMADKMVVRALAQAFGLTQSFVEASYGTSGDLGSVAKTLAEKAKKTKPVSIAEMHRDLVKLAKDVGTGSQGRKVKLLADTLSNLDPLSAKYTVRIVLGTTRLGFTEQTFIDALSNIVAGDKSASLKIEEKYNIHPDIGMITRCVKKGGLKGLDEVQIETGIPVLSQKAQRLSEPAEIVGKVGGIAWVEYKLDGTRVQLHIDRNKPNMDTFIAQNELFDFNKDKILAKTFTRTLEENTHQFPDIIESALRQIKAQSIILDGEAIGYDPKTGKYIPFQDTIQRKRKHDVGEYAKQIPMKYIVFDILFLNGKALTGMPLTKRHALLEQSLIEGGEIEIAQHIATSNPTKLWQHFELAKAKNLEGVIIKNPDAGYRAGAREFNWIKLKKSNTDLLEDTIDCVVLGYYLGRGSRVNFGIGGFLCGIWDPDKQRYVTLTKVGTGLRDEEWIELKQRCDKIKLNKPATNIEVAKALIPDVVTKPKIVVELGGDEITISKTHTSGFALRFPRLITFRSDKPPTETTSPKEILTLHKLARKGS